MIRIDFERRFTSGNLTGLTHRDSLTFPSRVEADRWQSGGRRNSRLGAIPYSLRVIAVIVCDQPGAGQ